MTKSSSSEDRARASIKRPSGTRNLSKSATRALDVLEYFAMVGRPLRAVEISQVFDLRTSSADQLLKTMVDSAYLMFDQALKLYYPSPRLVNFGAWLSSNYFGEDRIFRLIRSAHFITGEIVTLSVRCGSSMQIVDVVESSEQKESVKKGFRVPIIGSVIGIAFLSMHDDKDAIRILNQAAKDKDEKLSVAELRQLMDSVQACRADGYVSGRAHSGAKPWALAIPLPKSSHGVTMVLGLAGEIDSLRPRESDLVASLKNMVAQALNRPAGAYLK